MKINNDKVDKQMLVSKRHLLAAATIGAADYGAGSPLDECST